LRSSSCSLCPRHLSKKKKKLYFFLLFIFCLLGARLHHKSNFPPNQSILRKLNYHQFHLLLFRIAMAIKNSIYLFLPLQISLGIVFTLKVRNFQFNCVQVPIHFFMMWTSPETPTRTHYMFQMVQ